MSPYTPTVWNEGIAPGISAANLNNIESQYDEAVATAGTQKVKIKEADETVNNSEALQDDNHLFLPILANEIWFFDLYLYVTICAVSGFRCTFTVPAGATGGFAGVAGIYVPSSLTAFGTPNNWYTAINSTFWHHIPGFVANGTTPGNLQFKWAQYNNVAEDTKVLTNSFLIAHKLN